MGNNEGCGPGAQRGPTTEEKEFRKGIAANIRKRHQGQLNAPTNAGAAAKGGPMRRGKFRPKSGP